MPFDMSGLAKLKTRKAKAATVPRRATLVLLIVSVIQEDHREGINPTLLNHEGTLIASLRSGLCLRGWSWPEADRNARAIVAEAFTRAGAKRPAWKEGQPEHTEGGIIRQTRTTCANCEKGLEPEQHMYCCKTCAMAHRARLWRSENLEQARAIDRLRRRKHAQA